MKPIKRQDRGSKRPQQSLNARANRNRYRRSTSRKKGFTFNTGRLKGLWRATKILFSGVFLVALLAAFSAGMVMGYHYLMHAEYFTVHKLVVSGIHRVTKEEVLARSGLDRPANILTLRLGDMARQLRALPWVAEVTLTRKLPDTVLVRIREHVPRALITMGSLYYLSERGRAYKKVEAGEKPELPVVTGFTRADMVERPEFTRRDIEQVFALLDVLAERNDRFRVENISEINFDPVRGLTLFTRENNIQVRIGLGEYRDKLWRLGRVLAHLKITGQYEGLTYLNLECGPRVIVRRAANS